ncbi:MAG: type II toxin-antitoxin system death-on-curing family toxin, partial [Acidimicrobiales bacterium]
YLAIAAEVLGVDTDSLSRDQAQSGRLHAPAAGFEEQDFYPDFIDKAAVLAVRLTNNHALPDGNKRTAWVALRVFLEDNRWSWVTYPPVDEAEQTMIAVASGEWAESDLAGWLRARLRPPEGGPAD